MAVQGGVLVQTTAIEKKFSGLKLEEDILISESLISRIHLPALYEAVKVAEIRDIGEGTLDVYTLRENREGVNPERKTSLVQFPG